eukprot:GHVR01062955.1.p1 GENE.GHVR01062955.1~~GHVR01062955.1.p1  ORF type:complete len:168 (-),score=0.91 GHVR01062955.1:737-1240(-)
MDQVIFIRRFAMIRKMVVFITIIFYVTKIAVPSIIAFLMAMISFVTMIVDLTLIFEITMIALIKMVDMILVNMTIVFVNNIEYGVAKGRSKIEFCSLIIIVGVKELNILTNLSISVRMPPLITAILNNKQGSMHINCFGEIDGLTNMDVNPNNIGKILDIMGVDILK